MSPSNIAVSQLRQLIFYHIDNDLLDNANFLAGRLHALEPRSPDSSHLLALTYLRLNRYKAAHDFSQKHGANGRHLGCAYVFAQACLHLEKYVEGVTALEKVRAAWIGRSNWGKHSETSRRHLPDAAAVSILMAKLWHAQGDAKRAGDCYIDTHKANPFVWDAFEGLCKIGADLDLQNMFKPTLEMIGMSNSASTSSEISREGLSSGLVQPLAPQTNFNIQALTPTSDPFTSNRHDSQAGFFNKSLLQNANKQATLHWDTPNSNGGVLDEDVTMGGVHIDDEPFDLQPPPAPARRTRPGQYLDSLDRPRQPNLRSHAQSGSEGTLDSDASSTFRKPSNTAGGHKRTISGQTTSQIHGSSATDNSVQPRRSNRLFDQAAPTRSTRSATQATASIAGRTDAAARSSKTATGVRGRLGSTVGRVVSGNRKMLPPERGDKEKEKNLLGRTVEKATTIPSIPSVTSAVIQLPPKPAAQASEALEKSKAVNSLLDNFRDLAIACYASSRFQLPEAISAFKALPSAQRDTPWVLAQFGKAYYEASEYQSAEDCFARAMKMQPSRIEDTEVYSTVLWHLKKDSTLAFLCHVLRDLDYNAPQTWVAVGNAFSLSREHDQAIAAFKRAAQVDDRFAYAWTLMGHEYIANEEYDAALSAFRKSVTVDRRGYGGWYGLGKSYQRVGKLEEAERYYRIAATINPANPTLLVCIGMVLEKLRNKKAALTNYTKALELNPLSSLARFKKARVLMHLRCYPEALTELELLRDQAPDEANVWFLLGKCYKGMGDRAEALKAFTTALNLDVKAAPFIKDAMEMLHEDDDGESEED